MTLYAEVEYFYSGYTQKWYKLYSMDGIPYICEEINEQ
jgi:hypothetical protein